MSTLSPQIVMSVPRTRSSGIRVMNGEVYTGSAFEYSESSTNPLTDGEPLPAGFVENNPEIIDMDGHVGIDIIPLGADQNMAANGRLDIWALEPIHVVEDNLKVLKGWTPAKIGRISFGTPAAAKLLYPDSGLYLSDNITWAEAGFLGAEWTAQFGANTNYVAEPGSPSWAAQLWITDARNTHRILIDRSADDPAEGVHAAYRLRT